MKSNRVSAIFSTALSVALLGGCTFGQAPEPTPIPLLFTTSGAMPGSLRQVYTVQRGEIVDDMTFQAQVALDKKEDLFFGAAGRVQEVYVKSGDEVKLDQVIAVLDTRSLELDRQAAAELLKLAQERLALAEANIRFTRLQRESDLQAEKLKLQRLEFRYSHDTQLYRLDHALQELAIKQAELALQQLEAGVEPGLESDVTRAEIALQKVETALADAEITAPFGGQVLLYDALEKGKVVQAYSPVAALVDPAALVLEANLVPADLEALTEGMTVQIKLGDPLSKSIPGVVRTLPQPFGTGAGSSVLIVPSSAAALGRLRAGASVQVSVQRGQRANALWLPPDAVQGYKDNYYVRLQDGSEQQVQIGIFADDRVEIAGGLAFGEEVVGK
ncbi:MAG: HlyD family efflux transporter periplasmic adaptor subunit [Caldilineaceae bacterium]